MCLQGIKLVTFDVTNTLLKFKVPPWQHYTVVAKDHGFIGSSDEIKWRLTDNMKIMCKEYPNFGKSTISWERWWSELVKMTFKGSLPATTNLELLADKIIDDYKTSKCWYIAKGTDKIIDYFKNKKIPIGIISNFDPRLYSILQDTNLYNNFNFVVSSYEIGYSKPDERIFKKAIEMSNMKIKPHEALHIGDDLQKDYEGARAAGWHAILVNPNMNTKNKPADSHVFTTMEAFYEALEKEKLKI